MSAEALIIYGGWQGHQPAEVARLLGDALSARGFSVHLADTLDAFCDAALMRRVRLIIPIWTMGTITAEQLSPLLQAVRSGAGLAGCHGGMCDAFRNEPEYQFMTGGQWVAHPGGDGRYYRVHLLHPSPVTDGLDDFEVRTEQYYMHVDPAVRVHAITTFDDYDGVIMPVVWTKLYGRGRVFYCSLGHQADVVALPPVLAMMTRGMCWAAGDGDAHIGWTFAQVYCGAANPPRALP